MIPGNLLPKHLSWCVAGGWAACPSLAADQDVWVYDSLEPKSHLRSLLAHLAEQGFCFSVTATDMEKADDSYGDGRIEIYKVAVVNTESLKIHLMVTTARTIQDILDGFDVSTHQIAIGSNGYVVKGRGWTPITEAPVALLNNPQTPERMERIARRYGF